MGGPSEADSATAGGAGGPPFCRVEVFEAPRGREEASGGPPPNLSLVSPFFTPDLQLRPRSVALASVLADNSQGTRAAAAAADGVERSRALSFASILELSVHPTIQLLAEKLRRGVCVAFPTETVYGLGALATHAEAVSDVFRLKRRPPSDPLICHVLSVPQALEQVVDLDISDPVTTDPGGAPAPEGPPPGPSPLRRVFEALGAAFWPGPLSMVGKQRPLQQSRAPPSASEAAGCTGGGEEEQTSGAVPRGGAPLTGVVDAVTAGTGLVAVRVPHDPLALALLAAVGAPVAAPSANRFGCISPTCADHVVRQFDLQHQQQQQQQQEQNDVYELPVLDGGRCCAVGIESTVAKLLLVGGPPWDEGPPSVEVRVLRRGLISPHMLSEALEAAAAAAAAAAEPPFPRCFVSVSPAIEYTQERAAPNRGAPSPTAAAATRGPPRETLSGGGALSAVPPSGAPQESPGLCLTHYAPCVPSYLLQKASRCFEMLRAPGGGPFVSAKGAPRECGFLGGGPGGAPPVAPSVYCSRRCVLIDGDGTLSSLAKFFCCYIPLVRSSQADGGGGAPLEASTQGGPQGSEPLSGSAAQANRFAAAAAKGVFAALHAAEAAALQQQQQQQQQEVVVLLHAEPLLAWGQEGMAVFDRLFRAASGRSVVPLAVAGAPGAPTELLFGGP
ncbi:hypothetical protein Efla_002098 [Eimeria flavescens]